MSYIIIPRKRLIQPQGRIVIAHDWNDSVLSSYVGGNNFTEVKSQNDFGSYSSRPPENVVQGGIAAQGNGSSLNAVYNIPRIDLSGLTLLAVVQGGATSDRRAASMAWSASNGVYLGFGCGVTLASKLRVVTVVNAVSGDNTVTTDSDVFTAEPVAAALRWVRGVGTTAFVAGKKDRSATNTENSVFQYTSHTICALGRNTAVTFYSGLVHTSTAFNKALTDDQIKEITMYPYSIFKAEPRRLYFDVPTNFIPTLSLPTIANITSISARPGATLTF